MAAYTTTRLLTAIERQSFAPANQSTFSNTDILELAGEVTKTMILPAIMGVREEFYLDYYDYSITSGTAAYAIPERSIGASIREIQLVGADGGISNLPRISIDSLHLMGDVTGSPQAFYLRGNDVVLFPTPNTTSGTLRMYFPMRPGELVATTSTAIIATIDTSTKIVTVTSIPSTWTTGNIFDLIQRNGSHVYLDTDLTSTLISGSSITLPSLPSTLAVGDYISLAGESSLVQMPPDFQPILATLTAAEMLLAMNQPKGEKLYAKGMKQLEAAQAALTPRVVGEQELILPDWS